MDTARTPEELDVLLEDALLIGERQAAAGLFADSALLADRDAAWQVRGGDAIAEYALRSWSGASAYLAATSLVLQAGDIALLVAPEEVHVVRREAGGAWRFLILHRAGRKGVADGNDAEAGSRIGW
jgi:hypothetical protein